MSTVMESRSTQGVLRILASGARRRRDDVRAVRDLMRHELLHGDVSDDGVLPSDDDLEREYSVGRNVIRLALAALQQEGLVRRVQGSGTFIRNTKLRISRDRLQSLARSAEELSVPGTEAGIYYETQLLEHRPAPGVVATALGVPLGATVVVLERKSFFRGQPCSLTTRYLPADVASRLDEDALSTPDWLPTLEAAAGVAISGARTVTEAVVADELLAPDLGVPVGAPVLLRHLHVYAVTGRVLCFTVTRLRGDMVEIENWTDR